MTPTTADLLRRVRCATASPVLRAAVDRILEVGGERLFEVRLFDPGRVVCTFDEATCLWLTACGSVRLERRSMLGTGLRPMALPPGAPFGVFPGAPVREWPPPVSFAARAMDAVDAVVLMPERFDALLRLAPDLAEPFEFLAAQIRTGEQAEQKLRQLPGFSHLPVEGVVSLVWSGEAVRVTEPTTLVESGVIADRIYLLLDGSGQLVRPDAYGQMGTTAAQPGDLFGVLSCLSQTNSPEKFTVDRGALLACFPYTTFVNLLSRYPVMRRAFELAMPPGVLDLVLVASDIPEAPLAEITTVLSRLLERDLQEESGIIHLVASGGTAVSTDAFGVVHITAVAPRPEDVCGAIRAAMKCVRGKVPAIDLLLLDPTAPSDAHLQAAAPLLSRVSWLSRDPRSSPPGALGDGRVERVGLLGPTGGSRPPLWPPGAPRMRLDWAEVRRLAAGASGGGAARYTSNSTTEGLGRWGRALCNRLVGIALGGGGSPGFSHVALIRALEREGLPIDMISGTSFGALVGGWYAGLLQLRREEPARLQTLVDAGKRLNTLLAIGVVDNRALEKFVNDTFEGLLLGDLEVPFYPVSSEIDSGTVFIGHSESLGEAVRMSGAFPPFFPPVVKDAQSRIVDGGFVNNVPASVLRLEGAGFVLASNSIGLIPPRAPSRIPGRAGVMFSALNPVARIEDALRGVLLLFHRVGEAQSEFADLTFESRYTGFQFWDFARGEEVISATQESADVFGRHVGQIVVRAQSRFKTLAD